MSSASSGCKTPPLVDGVDDSFEWYTRQYWELLPIIVHELGIPEYPFTNQYNGLTSRPFGFLWKVGTPAKSIDQSSLFVLSWPFVGIPPTCSDKPISLIWQWIHLPVVPTLLLRLELSCQMMSHVYRSFTCVPVFRSYSGDCFPLCHGLRSDLSAASLLHFPAPGSLLRTWVR